MKKASTKLPMNHEKCPLCDGKGDITSNEAFNFMFVLGFTNAMRERTNLISDVKYYVEKLYSRVMNNKV